MPPEVPIEVSGKHFVSDNCLYAGKANVEFAAAMMRCPVNATGGYFRLKDGRYRLWFAR